tara:strand:- start:1320 stop:2861 length:1542 start_codon:yes stop_codon:yes gene_type:complete
MTGLFISGINSSWATSISNPSSNSNQTRQANIYLSQANQRVVYELNHPAYLSLPSSKKEVLVRTYQKIKLNQLENILIKNNPTIKIYSEKIDQAKSLLKNSLSFWYPNLNLTANGIPQYLESNNYYDSIPDTSSKQWSSSISAQIQWDIVNPARIPEIAAARDSLEKAKYSYSIIMKDIQLEAKKRYFNLQKANEEIKVAEKSIESSTIGLKDAETRFNAGIGTKLEILEARTQLARDQQLLNTKKSEQKIGQRSLAEILNLPEDVTPIIDSKTQLIGIWNTSLEESIISAYSKREELNNILLDISISNSDANSALASGQPKISIVNTFTSTFNKGELNKVSPNTNNESSVFSNTVGLNASWYIFDGGSSKSLYKFNKSKSKEAKINFAKKRASIRKEVEEVFFKLESAKLNISASHSEVLSAEESLRLANLRYKSGITTQREIVNHQRDFTDSKVRYIVAVTDYNILLVDLSRKTGLDNIQPCEIKINEKDSPSRENLNSISDSNSPHLCQP